MSRKGYLYAVLDLSEGEEMEEMRFRDRLRGGLTNGEKEALRRLGEKSRIRQEEIKVLAEVGEEEMVEFYDSREEER